MNLDVGVRQHVQLADQLEFVRFSKSEINQSIPRKFEAQVSKRPHDVAIKSEGVSRTYEELNIRANRLAHAMVGIAGEKSEPVVLLLDQGVEAVEAILATLKAGKIYVALDPSFPIDRLRRTIAECKPSIILTDRAHCVLAGECAGEISHLLCIDQDPIDGNKTNPRLSIDCDQPCYIYYTSGSTGRSKGVVDSHRNVLHNVLRYTNSLKISRRDRLSLIQSFSFSGTVSTLFAGLLNGGEVHLFDLRKKGIDRLAGWMNEQQITIYHSVPAIFERLGATGHQFPHLRLIRLEGDQSHIHHVAAYQEHFDDHCVLVNGLGATETGLTRQYFMTPATKLSGQRIPIGFEVDDMEVLLLGKEGQPISVGEIGEIVVRSRYLAQEYWQRPDLTEATFQIDPEDNSKRLYRSGDLGRMGADNCLEFLGRAERSRLEHTYEKPRTELEQLVASCFEKALGIGRVGRIDDLFDLGADSLQTTEFFLLLEEKTGQSLSADIILQASTVEALAKALSEDKAAQRLVAIQPMGTQPPLFCLHNYPGTVWEYGRLADILGPDQPLYGLRSADGPAAAVATVETMAFAFVEEIKRVQPDGPYHLCGNCFGGTIAFEMAQQLQRAGEEIGLLALIDTAFPASGLRLVGRQLNLVRNWRSLRSQPPRKSFRFLWERFLGLSNWFSRESRRRSKAQSRNPDLSVADINRLAESRYRPRTYDGTAVLYCIGRPHNQRGWRKNIRSGLSIVELAKVPGIDDQAHIISEPYVDKLATDLRGRIGRNS